MAENLGNIGETFVKIKADMDDLHRDVARLKSKMEREGQDAGNAFNRGFKKVLAIGGIMFALRKAFDFAVIAKNAARDADEISSKFNTVFISLEKKANSMADNFAKNFGIAKTTARDLLSSTGDLLVGFGFAEEEAFSLSQRVNSLAQDLASFTNFSGGAKGASDALTKAILGETESAKSLGIVIRQNSEEFLAEVQQLKDSKGLTEQQAKAIVILGEAYKQSAKAVGDYERTKESLANTERRLNEEFKEFQEDIGRQLGDTYKVLITLIAQMSSNMGDATGSMSAFGIVVKGIATPLIVIMTLIKQIGNLIGTVGAGLANFVLAPLGLSNDARVLKSFSTGWDIMLKDSENMNNALYSMWSDTSKKVGDLDMAPGASRTSGTAKTVPATGGKDEDIIKAKMSAYDKMYNDLKHLAWGYTDYRKQLIQEEYEGILKLTGDAVNAEAWKNEQLKQLAEERQAFFDEPLQDSMMDDIAYMDGLIAKDDERTENRMEQERELADVRAELSEKGIEANEAFADSLAGGLTQGIMAGKSLGEIFKNLGEQLLGMVIQASILKGLMGLLSLAGGGVGLLSIFGAHSGGTFIGAGGGNVMKMAGGGSFKVPGGYPNDSFGPLYVESGERVSVTPANRTGDQDRLLSSLVGRFDVMNMNIVDLMTTKRNNNFLDVNIHGEITDRAIALSNKREQKQSDRIR